MSEDPIRDTANHLKMIEQDVRSLELLAEDAAHRQDEFRGQILRELRELRAIRFNTGYTFYFAFLSFVVLCLILWRLW